MTRNIRSKVFLNKFNKKVVVIVIDVIKGRRKIKKFIKSIVKFISKKKNIELFNINERNFSFIIITESFKISIKLSAYIINMSVIWKKKEVRIRIITFKEFDFHEFNIIIIKVVEKKASKKGYKIIL